MMTLSGVKLLIWDLDGTLIDSFGVYASILREAAELSGLSMPDEQKLLHNFHGSLNDSIKSALDLVDGDDFERLLNDFLQVQENYYKNPESHLYPDALALMKRVNQAAVQQVIVTNRYHAGRGSASPRYLVEHSSMKAYVSGLVPGDETQYRKPDARSLNNLELTEVSPQQMVVIGDQFVDAQLAQNIGCRAVLISRGAEPIAHLQELGDDTAFMTVVSSLDEVNIT